MEKKYEKFNAGNATVFVDPEGYKAYVADREQAFLTALEKQMRN